MAIHRMQPATPAPKNAAPVVLAVCSTKAGSLSIASRPDGAMTVTMQRANGTPFTLVRGMSGGQWTTTQQVQGAARARQLARRR